jgi:hypothetical protein
MMPPIENFDSSYHFHSLLSIIAFLYIQNRFVGLVIGDPAIMFEFVAVIAGIIVGLAIFGMIALRWGYDSREPLDSPEWERRQKWLQP